MLSLKEAFKAIKDEMLNIAMRERAFIFVESIITLLTASVATIVNFVTNQMILGYVTLGFSIFLFVFTAIEMYFFSTRRNLENRIFLYTNFGITYVLVILYLIFSPQNGLYLYWIVSVPILINVVGGLKRGLLYSFLLLLIIVLFFFVPPFTSWMINGDSGEEYTTFKVFFILNYMMTIFIGAVVAFINDTIIKRLNELKEDYYKDANTDITTGLKNQLYFLSYIQGLSNTLKIGDTIGLMFIDVDDFKSFNDRYGHMVGNDVLIKVANKLNEVPHSLLVRWGGDEFAVIERNITKDEFIAKANYLLKSVEGMGDGVTISIGLAYYTVDENFNFDKVFNDADMKTIRAKDKGKNCIVFTDE